MRALLSTLLLCAAAQAVCAQTVYRCGADGSTYSHTPCPQGKAVDADDRRTKAERDAARQVAREDARLAAQLAKERRAREAAAVPTAAGFDTVPKDAPAPKAPKSKPKKGEHKAKAPPASKTNASQSSAAPAASTGYAGRVPAASTHAA